jgi:hypothetical protein
MISAKAVASCSLAILLALYVVGAAGRREADVVRHHFGNGDRA